MNLRVPALVCSARPHGETGVVARVLTREHGLLAGYVRGGRSRRLRPILMPGNRVEAELRARVDTQLPAMTVDLIESCAPLLAEPLAAGGIEWATALVAAALPEGHPYPRLHDALDGLVAAIALSGSARDWAGGLVRFERAMLAELGFGADQEGPTMLFEALQANGENLAGHLLTGREGSVLDARARLVERLRRALLPPKPMR